MEPRGRGEGGRLPSLDHTTPTERSTPHVSSSTTFLRAGATIRHVRRVVRAMLVQRTVPWTRVEAHSYSIQVSDKSTYKVFLTRANLAEAGTSEGPSASAFFAFGGIFRW